MNEETVTEYAKIMKGEIDAEFLKVMVSEIFTEVNQLNQRFNELKEEIKQWREKQELH